MKKSTVWMLLMLLLMSVAVLGGYAILVADRVDNEAPVITMDTEELVLSVSEAQSGLLKGVRAEDNKDGDVTASLVVESLYGINKDAKATVTYAAFDEAGNVTKAGRRVQFTDYHSPRFKLSRALVFEFGYVKGVMDAVEVMDILDGDISHRLKATMLTYGSTVTAEGSHEVQFRATNSLGDTAELVLPVEVYPADSYNGELELKEYLIYLSVGDSFRPEAYLKALRTRQQELMLQPNYPEGVQVRIQNGVNTSTPGVYAVTYTVTHTDERGQETTGYSRLMVVVEE